MLTTKLSSQNHFLYHNNTPFILSNSIEKDIDKLIFKIEIKQLFIKDEVILKQIAEACRKDINSSTLISKVSGKVLISHNFDREEAENLLFSLIPMMTVEKVPYSSSEYFVIELINEPKLVFPFTAIGLWRFFKALKSFVDNYLVLLASFNAEIQNKYEVVKEKTENEIKQEIDKKDGGVIVKDESVKSQNKMISSFCDFCCNTPVKLLLFELIFRYYGYISDDTLQFKEKNGKKYLLIPSIFPDSFIFNIDYIRSVFKTTHNVNISSIYLIYKKLMIFLSTKKLTEIPPIYIYSTLFLLSLYSYAFIKEKDSNWIDNTIFDEFIKNSRIQSNVINYFMNEIYNKEQGSGSFNFVLCGNDKEIIINDNYSNDKFLNKIISEFSDEYKHIINISEEKFSELIFDKINNYNNNQETIKEKINLIKDFVLNDKKILNMDDISYYNSKLTTEKKTSFYSPLVKPLVNYNTNDIPKEYLLLNYNFNNPYFSELFFYINKYISTPSIISKLKEDKILPLEIINLFNYFSNILFKTNVLKKEMNSTLDYYNIILETINSPENFKHSTILYIIFQGIIPYYMKNYNKKLFIDYLL